MLGDSRLVRDRSRRLGQWQPGARYTMKTRCFRKCLSATRSNAQFGLNYKQKRSLFIDQKKMCAGLRRESGSRNEIRTEIRNEIRYEIRYEMRYEIRNNGRRRRF